MRVQMTAAELIELGNFIDDLNAFAEKHSTIFDMDAITFDFVDSNGDVMGTIAACDWGEFGFIPDAEVEE